MIRLGCLDRQGALVGARSVVVVLPGDALEVELVPRFEVPGMESWGFYTIHAGEGVVLGGFAAPKGVSPGVLEWWCSGVFASGTPDWCPSGKARFVGPESVWPTISGDVSAEWEIEDCYGHPLVALLLEHRIEAIPAPLWLLLYPEGSAGGRRFAGVTLMQSHFPELTQTMKLGSAAGHLLDCYAVYSQGGVIS